MAQLTAQEQQELRREMLQLNAKAWGVATGLLGGITIFLATIVLVVRGGENVGQHLGLLSVYLPGYRVSVGGAFLGFVYVFVFGYAIGRLIGWIYNWSATPKD